MEKSETRKYGKWFFGLLVVLFITSSLYAQSNLYGLKFHQKDDYIFSLSNTEFYVDIENISPNMVTVYVNSIPENVELVSIKKETYIPPIESTNSTYGTHIVLTVRFLKSGNFRLHPCDIQIKTGFYQIGFNSVHVYDNIQIIKPELSVHFDRAEYNGKTSSGFSVPIGTHIEFTVYVRQAAEVQGITWNIPENSLFEKIADYDVPKLSEQKFELFSRDFPVAKFDWCPLKEGTVPLPSVNVVTVSLGGSVETAKFPSYTVRVTGSLESTLGHSNEKKTVASVISPDLTDAFAVPDVSYTSGKITELSFEQTCEYCQLLQAEKHSFPLFSDAARKRIKFENTYELPHVRRMPSVILFYCLIITALLLTLVSVFFLLRKAYSFSFVCASLLLLFTVMSIFNGVRIKRQYAVVQSGKLMSVPEKDISAGVELSRGSVICVRKIAGDWLYVTSSDASGWIQKDGVIFID